MSGVAKTSRLRRIALAASELIRSGQSIFLDASTTAFQIARLIKDREELTVVTNGLYTALELSFCPGITVVVVGGVVRQRSSSLVGGLNQDLLGRLRVDSGFFGARGVTARDGLTETDLDEARKLINALAGLVTAAAPEISDSHARPLRDGLRSVQLAFREASSIPDAPGKGPGEKFTGSVI